MTTLKAPAGTGDTTIHGVLYRPDKRGLIEADPAHVGVLRVHGYTDPTADGPATPAGPVVLAAEPAPYFTGPYRGVLTFLRGLGVDVADDCADAALLRGLDEALGEPVPDAPDAPEQVDRADPPAGSPPAASGPDLAAMTQPGLIEWLKANGVTVPKFIAKAEALRIATERLAEISG